MTLRAPMLFLAVLLALVAAAAAVPHVRPAPDAAAFYPGELCLRWSRTHLCA